MTYRLTVIDSDKTRHVQELDDFPAVLQAMMGQVPWHDQPLVLTIQRLGPWESVTWSVVAPGDEVIAPNNTVWMVEDVTRADGVARYTLANALDDTSAVTTPQPDAMVRRRRGPISEVRQMLTDADVVTRFV